MHRARYLVANQASEKRTCWDWVFSDVFRRAIPWTRLLLREGRLDNDLNIDARSRWSALLVSASLASLPCAFYSLSQLAIPVTPGLPSFHSNKENPWPAFLNFTTATAEKPLTSSSRPVPFYNESSQTPWERSNPRNLLFTYSPAARKGERCRTDYFLASDFSKIQSPFGRKNCHSSLKTLSWA